jgi:hypothetical protein
MMEILIQIKFQETLHAGTHRHTKRIVLRLERYAFPYLYERHILQLLDQLVGFVYTDSILPDLFFLLREGKRRAGQAQN